MAFLAGAAMAGIELAEALPALETAAAAVATGVENAGWLAGMAEIASDLGFGIQAPELPAWWMENGVAAGWGAAAAGAAGIAGATYANSRPPAAPDKNAAPYADGYTVYAPDYHTPLTRPQAAAPATQPLLMPSTPQGAS